MSEFRDVLNGVVSERQSFTGDVVRNLRTGVEFTAEIEGIEDVALNAELGRDPREAVLVHVQDRAVSINMNDKLEFDSPGGKVTLKVVRRKDNPEAIQIEYGCMKWTDKDS